MEFKVVLPDDGYELIITVLGVEMNLEVIKDGKSVKSYEHLPIEILSQITSDSNPETETEQDDAEFVETKTDDEDEYNEEEDICTFDFFDGQEDLDQTIHEFGERIENKTLLKRLTPIVMRHYDDISEISVNMVSGFTDPEYTSAIESVTNGFIGLRNLSNDVIRELGTPSNKSNSKPLTISTLISKNKKPGMKIFG